jgi:FkbM family methyltransferase
MPVSRDAAAAGSRPAPSLKRLLRRLLPPAALDVLRRLRKLSPRLVADRRRFRRWNRGAGADEIVLRPGLRLRIDPRSREPFEWFCWRSPEMVRELDQFLREAAGRQRFLDVGACHGIFALAFTAGRPERQALALDPSPVAFEVLAANAALNGCRNLAPLQLAAGAENGALHMRYEWHHLKAVPEGPRAEGTVAVPVRTLDGLCAERGFAPDLVKIDVEGYEAAVLRGAQRLLAERAPVLFLEVHPPDLAALGESPGEIYDLLASLGYRCFDLGGRPFDRARFAGIETSYRILCRPRAASGPPST